MSPTARILLLPTLVLAACSSSQTPDDDMPPSPPPSVIPYETFASDAAVTSELAGYAVVVREGSDGRIFPQRVRGSITHSSGRTIIDDNIYRLIDEDGGDDVGRLGDGRATAQLLAVGQGTQGAYEFGRIYIAEYSEDGADYTAGGVIGIPTRTVDIPRAGTAKFKGFGEIGAVFAPGIITTNTATFNELGTSKLDVDFATGKVNAEVALGDTSNPLLPLDRIAVRGMAMSGNTFGRGTIKIFNDGEQVDLTGTLSRSASEGIFLGAKRNSDGDLVPAEVGGSMLHAGDRAVIFGVYLAK